MKQSGDMHIVEPEHIRRVLRTTRDARLARRLMAVLEVLEGERPEKVAQTLGGSRRTVYRWLGRLAEAETPDVLADKPRSGRPPVLPGQALRRLRHLLESKPEKFGFFSTEWTEAMLRAEL